MDNFDLKKYLVENKTITNSKMLSEATSTSQAVNKLESMGFHFTQRLLLKNSKKF